MIADGPPGEVLHPYVLERTYGASMEVLQHGGMPVVLERRHGVLVVGGRDRGLAADRVGDSGHAERERHDDEDDDQAEGFMFGLETTCFGANFHDVGAGAIVDEDRGFGQHTHGVADALEIIIVL